MCLAKEIEVSRFDVLNAIEKSRGSRYQGPTIKGRDYLKLRARQEGIDWSQAHVYYSEQRKAWIIIEERKR